MEPAQGSARAPVAILVLGAATPILVLSKKELNKGQVVAAVLEHASRPAVRDVEASVLEVVQGAVEPGAQAVPAAVPAVPEPVGDVGQTAMEIATAIVMVRVQEAAVLVAALDALVVVPVAEVDVAMEPLILYQVFAPDVTVRAVLDVLELVTGAQVGVMVPARDAEALVVRVAEVDVPEDVLVALDVKRAVVVQDVLAAATVAVPVDVLVVVMAAKEVAADAAVHLEQQALQKAHRLAHLKALEVRLQEVLQVDAPDVPADVMAHAATVQVAPGAPQVAAGNVQDVTAVPAVILPVGTIVEQVAKEHAKMLASQLVPRIVMVVVLVSYQLLADA